MARTYDVLVIGLGAMGSAAVFHIARRGLRVLGIDRFRPPHEYGSSHGLTRIIREAYYEHPLYVPLVRRAFELWGELERESGQGAGSLMVRNGGLTLGRVSSALVRGVLASASEHNVPHEVLPPAQLRRRFSRYVVRDDWAGVYEPGAGFLRPEAIIGTHLDLARRHGAELQADTAAREWHDAGGVVRVETTDGAREAGQVVICAGAWAGLLTGGVTLPLLVERQVSHWFAPVGDASFAPGDMPVTMWELDGGRIFYTTPDVGRGVKAGFHHGGEITSAADVRRSVLPDEQQLAARTFAALVPDAAGPSRGALVCLYTNTPDANFLIDSLPQHPGVHLVSACSGHGFKFSSAIGEIVADRVQGREPRVNTGAFAMKRFVDTSS